MEVEYVMRCKLPFASRPSGDTVYEEAYRSAIMANLPRGFEIAWKTKGTWPVDRDGLTWVKLYCTNREDAMNRWRQEAIDARREIDRLVALAKQMGAAL